MRGAGHGVQESANMQNAGKVRVITPQLSHTNTKPEMLEESLSPLIRSAFDCYDFSRPLISPHTVHVVELIRDVFVFSSFFRQLYSNVE